MIHRFFILLLLTINSFACAQEPNISLQDTEAAKLSALEEKRKLEYLLYLKQQQEWVDSTFSKLTEDEKIGQLFMATAYSNLSSDHVNGIKNLIENHHIGGVIFMQGGPLRQAKLLNEYQELAKIPLLVSMDAEYGLAMRLDSTIMFPKQMTLGAIENDKYIYEMGAEIARQIKRVGAHVNFAPVVDVNVNPANPVIGFRSFGENKERVAQKGVAYMKGMQHNGVIANAKHFPGHGDTNMDSHYSLPVINHDVERINAIELYPFKALFADSLGSVMVAHLQIPALDDTPNLATSLSPKVVTGLLKDSLGYNGLIFTDALNMQGVAKYFKPGEIAVKSLMAGNDVLLSPNDIPASIEAIKKAMANNELTAEEIDDKVKKILRAKYKVGLNHYKPVELKGIYDDLNNKKALAIKARLYEQAVTVVKNEGNLLPLKNIDSLAFGSLSFGLSQGNKFQETLDKYGKFEHFSSKTQNINQTTINSFYEKLKDKDVVFVSIHKMSNRGSKQYGISNTTISLIQKLEKVTKVIVIPFGNPYALKYFENSKLLVCAYENDPLMQAAVPQVLFGAVENHAKLPVTASKNLREGMGFKMVTIGRMGFGEPESVGMKSEILNKIDSIANQAIAYEATPGCQVLVAKEGKIIFNRSYGYHTYSNKEQVTNSSIFDLASLTKVLSTLQAVMLLEEQGKINLEGKLSDYLPELEGTNKANIILKQVLTHQAGLKAFIPFWEKMKIDNQHNPAYLSTTPSEKYSIQITPDLFALSTIEDSVWKWTVETDLARKRYRYRPYSYRYSDLGFIILKRIIEKVSGEQLENFVANNIYNPLGLKSLGFNPLNKFDKSQIVPTEMDIYTRNSLIHGFVHDPAAALAGGVGGHAGLFSNALDIAILLQMNLQEGYYGGKWYLQPETLAKFNSRPYESNRRGLGWDKPSLKRERSTTSDLSSDSTFGHTGFTGTCAWVDPAYNLVYIFLSNRIHPFVGNKKLLRENVRTSIQDVIYESITDFSHLEAKARR
ncbi:glycoside hydrolase family 3 N-terminal domain-containing protein [Flexithrix dorotheae]|uniref:glycoside hydrolase family 3 N-terminal domain-containing protein n=1 Tax=Flexithrix dorotheae TaxID=70993 RepID=UPI00037A5F8D|nr:glycoside hydrolase family 3 N-terminal domain-containing protein [Flexithrix dorotheae]